MDKPFFFEKSDHHRSNERYSVASHVKEVYFKDLIGQKRNEGLGKDKIFLMKQKELSQKTIIF